MPQYDSDVERLEADVERLEAEIERLREYISEVRCCKCDGVVTEFTIPNKTWNTVVRKNGPETNREYLCIQCFADIAAAEIERLQAEVERRNKPLADPAFATALVEWAGEATIQMLKAEVERLEADIERLEVVKARAIKVVEQTTPDAAYARHDDLIAAIEAAERYI